MAAIYEADKYYIVPRMDAPGYLDVILDICEKEKITGVLSLIDPELSLWNGSSGGIDLERFDFAKRQQWRSEVREELGYNDSDFVYGFVGRITRDKGINELLEAYFSLHAIRLMLVISSCMSDPNNMNDIKIFKTENGEYESMVQRVYRQIKKIDSDAKVTIATSKTQVSAIHNQLGDGVGKGLNGLPKSDVLKFILENNCSVVVRPSGTEPKLKTYISVSAKTKSDAEDIEKKITEELNGFFK